MGVIFDEVIGEVEPESASPKDEKADKASSKPASMEKMRQSLYRLKQREARLCAD